MHNKVKSEERDGCQMYWVCLSVSTVTHYCRVLCVQVAALCCASWECLPGHTGSTATEQL
jgi:hypothetical protein